MTTLEMTATPKAEGQFIVFEGLDGSGKTTMAGLFAEYLHKQGIPTARTREPGGSPFAEQCRHLLFTSPGLSAATQALLVNAARRDHVEKMIVPTLKEGTTVVCDRWTLSTMVYQAAMKPTHDLDTLCDIGSAGLMPDVIFILASDFETFKERTKDRVDNNHLDEKDEAKFTQQLQTYVQYHAGGRRPTIWINSQGTKEEVLAVIIHEYQHFRALYRQSITV